MAISFRGHDEPIHGSCAVYFAGGIVYFNLWHGRRTAHDLNKIKAAEISSDPKHVLHDSEGLSGVQGSEVYPKLIFFRGFLIRFPTTCT